MPEPIEEKYLVAAIRVYRDVISKDAGLDICTKEGRDVALATIQKVAHLVKVSVEAEESPTDWLLELIQRDAPELIKQV